MKYLKTPFSRLHFLIFLFASLNIIGGIMLSLSVNFGGKLNLVHMIFGILVIIIPLSYIIFSKDRKAAITALKARIFINKFDIKNKKYYVIVTKIIAWIFMVSLVLIIIEGILIKTGILASLIPSINFLRLHTKLVFFMPALLVIHAITMKIMILKKPKKNEYKIIK